MRSFKLRLVVLAAAIAMSAAACSPAPESSSAPERSDTVAAAPPPPAVEEPAPAETPVEPAAGAPDYNVATEGLAPGAGVPMAPSSSPPADMPPAAAGDPPTAAIRPAPKNGHSGSKVLSYFQRNRTKVDTNRAFGFVLMPKVAVTEQEQRVQKDFCKIVLASMDFMTPGAVASSAPADVLATYWPVVGSRESFEIKAAFADRNCDDLIAWYDHRLARALADKAGIAELSGPLLITWPSSVGGVTEGRDPLIVDFSRADQPRAKKALQYWFRQLKGRPELWTNRIREGTIRAELADAVNDTAGVMLSVLAGKWDSLTVVVASAEP